MAETHDARGEPPFIKPLQHIKQGNVSELYQIEDRPDLYVRELVPDLVEKMLEGEGEPVIEQPGLIRRHFERLASYVPTAYLDTVIGPNRQGESATYVIGRTVNGPSLADESPLENPAIYQQAVRAWCADILRYLEESHATQQPVYYDVGLDQCRWGVTEQDPERKVYITDLDPVFVPLTKHFIMRYEFLLEDINKNIVPVPEHIRALAELKSKLSWKGPERS